MTDIKHYKQLLKKINKTLIKINEQYKKYKEELLIPLKSDIIKLKNIIQKKKEYLELQKENQLIYNRKNIVALDPGERIFQTFYSPSECGLIGENMRITILKYQKKIKKYQKLLAENKNEINGNSIKHKKQLTEKIQKKYNNIKNITADLRNKTALFFCRNYNNILIPEFKTQKMIKKVNITKKEMKVISKKNKLNKKIKFVLNMLSHYKFKQHLINKSNEYGCNVITVTEDYTSQCCGYCGSLSKKYNGRTKICDYCNNIMHRDINGARNILLKNLPLLKAR